MLIECSLHGILTFHISNLILSLLHLLVERVQLWCTESVLLCRCHLLSDSRLLVMYISRSN